MIELSFDGLIRPICVNSPRDQIQAGQKFGISFLRPLEGRYDGALSCGKSKHPAVFVDYSRGEPNGYYTMWIAKYYVRLKRNISR